MLRICIPSTDYYPDAKPEISNGQAVLSGMKAEPSRQRPLGVWGLGMFILVFRFDSDSQMIRNLFLILLNRNTRAKFLGSTALCGK